MALWELNTPEMDKTVTCDYCSTVVEGDVNGYYYSEDVNKAICVPCLHAGKREEEK